MRVGCWENGKSVMFTAPRTSLLSLSHPIVLKMGLSHDCICSGELTDVVMWCNLNYVMRFSECVLLIWTLVAYHSHMTYNMVCAVVCFEIFRRI